MERKYINKTNAAGIHITEASPIDDRAYIRTEAEVMALDNVEPFPGIMYDGMVVQIEDSRKEYIWVESETGLMTGGFVYPEYFDDIQGQNYANKKYNFVLFDSVCKIELTYSDILDDGLLIPLDKLPYHILQDMTNATVTMKSSTTAFVSLEYPDYTEARAEGLMVILDPKPALAESFKITIS